MCLATYHCPNFPRTLPFLSAPLWCFPQHICVSTDRLRVILHWVHVVDAHRSNDKAHPSLRNHLRTCDSIDCVGSKSQEKWVQNIVEWILPWLINAPTHRWSFEIEIDLNCWISVWIINTNCQPAHRSIKIYSRMKHFHFVINYQQYMIAPSNSLSHNIKYNLSYFFNKRQLSSLNT